MKITKAEFLTSAAKKNQYPPEGPVEIAFAGRSNVGKSSLINLLTGRKNLYQISFFPSKVILIETKMNKKITIKKKEITRLNKGNLNGAA